MMNSKAIALVKNEILWQDRDVRFDASPKELVLRQGEKIIEAYDHIEDSKGNSGDEGRLTITNLRILWQSKAKPRINLTIGLNCIVSINNRTFHNKLRGKYDALNLMSKSNATRYEFIFTQFLEDGVTPLDASSPKGAQMIQCVTKVCKAYSCTKLFRDLKLRSAIFSAQGKQLKILTSEQIYNKFQGVWNLSSDQGNLGTMHVTNLRIVWHANVNELFNLSLPYVQISCIKVRESKFGPALVIESTESSGGYVLGFRIDPQQRLHSVYSQLANLYNVHAANPNFGVEVFMGLELGSVWKGGPEITQSDDYNDDETKEDNPDVIVSYLADDYQSLSKDNEVVFCPQLGLAIEKIKEGYTLESLWEVIPKNF